MLRLLLLSMLAGAAYDSDASGNLAGGVYTGNINLNTNLLLNIGNAGTDFTPSGGLTAAGQVQAASFNGSTDGKVLLQPAAGAGTTYLQLGGTSGVWPTFCATSGPGTQLQLASDTGCTTNNNLQMLTLSGIQAYQGTSRIFIINALAPPTMYLNNAFNITWRNNQAIDSGSDHVGIYDNAAGALCLTSGGTTCTGALGALTSRRATLITSITQTLATTGLSVPMKNGVTYILHVWAPYNNTTASEGVQFDFNGSAFALTDFRLDCTMDESGQVAQDTVTEVTTLAGTVTKAALVGTGAAFMECDGMITAGADGSFTPRFAEAGVHATGTLTLQRGAYVRAEAVP